MKSLDLTFSGPDNLACDEALLDACDEDHTGEVLRFWEPRDYFVVVGYANQIDREVNLSACRREAVDVYRRCSGGGAVLQGPGCLNYSLLLRINGYHPVDSITSTNRYIMERHKAALGKALKLPVKACGVTDLAIAGRKFSGNAQRRKRNALIFHGTFLLGLDLAKVERFLSMPSREPDYRGQRTHGDFMINLQTPAVAIKKALQDCWEAQESFAGRVEISEILKQKYSSDEWNLKF